MPLGDGTGPAGRGPRTGRGMGSCSPNSERANFSAGGGFRKGRGGEILWRIWKKICRLLQEAFF